MSTTIPESLADQIIKEKIQEWERNKKDLKLQKDLQEVEVFPFVTVSRDLGCHEEEIIPQLEKTMGWKVYGRNLLDHLATRENLSRNFIETLDEHRLGLIDNWVNFLIHSGAILQDDYVVRISKLIKVIVAQESAIFLGRGANFILADKEPGIRVHLTAPSPHRVSNLMQVRSISEKEAQKQVKETDEQRNGFLKRYFGKDIQDSGNFDLTLNTQKMSTDLICKTIAYLIEEKQK